MNLDILNNTLREYDRNCVEHDKATREYENIKEQSKLIDQPQITIGEIWAKKEQMIRSGGTASYTGGKLEGIVLGLLLAIQSLSNRE